MKKLIAILLIAVMMVATLAGCSTSNPLEATPAATDAPAAAPDETAAAEEAEATAEPAASDNQAICEDDKAYIGCVTHLTGSKAALGEYQHITNDAWVDYINKNGGILGKQVEVVYFDCVDDIQTAINAYELAAEDTRLSAISLSTYSQNCIAVLDLADQYKIPTFMGGSGDAINVGNKYVWMTRPLDSAAGQAMVAYIKELGYTNPVLVHNTLASCLAGAEATADALDAAGFTFDRTKMMFGYEDTETNFAPLVAQMQATNPDCLIFFGNQQDGANLSKAIQDAGWDITKIGNSTISHANTIELAGSAINGWYCVAESSIESDKPENVEWIKILKDYYGDDFEMTTNYYGCNIMECIKTAMETCGSTTDKDAINEAIKSVDIETANGHLSYFGDNDLASQMFICQMVDQKASLIKAVSFR